MAKAKAKTIEAEVERCLEVELRERREEYGLRPAEARIYDRAWQDYVAYTKKKGWLINAHTLAAYVLDHDLSHGTRQIVATAFLHQNALKLMPVFAVLRYCAKRDRDATRAA